jgi:hypothetical protein
VLSIEEAAERSVARGTGFAALAAGVTMSGLSFVPVLSLKTGAAIALLTWAVLALKALRARRRPYRRTEVWLMLDPKPALPRDQAQRLIGEALERAFRRYAARALLTAVALWLASLAADAAGLP